jgi:glycine/D-amino acid oxidase-like deaminating enzyme
MAHAYYPAMRGSRVVVFERNRQAAGASIRKFGMVWLISQPAGVIYELARPAHRLSQRQAVTSARTVRIDRVAPNQSQVS